MEVFACRSRKPFVGLALSALGGIAVADWIGIPAVWLLAAVAVAVGFGMFRPRREACWVVTLHPAGSL